MVAASDDDDDDDSNNSNCKVPPLYSTPAPCAQYARPYYAHIDCHIDCRFDEGGTLQGGQGENVYTVVLGFLSWGKVK